MAEAAIITVDVDQDDRLEECFERISSLMYEISGVRLPSSKIGMVRSRLRRRLPALGLPGFPEYANLVESGCAQEEISTMVNLLTTNKTSFFREEPHFDFISDELLPQIRQSERPLTIWCAGCSSGQEPYSLAMLLREGLPHFGPDTVRILATDLSSRVLEVAKTGIYEADLVEAVRADMRKRAFRPVTNGTGERAFQVVDPVRSVVKFARLNLMTTWPMRGPFDLILCRNVMIYFDKPTRERLVQRFSDLLAPGGHLFVGHSEGLNNLQHDLRYVQPAVYQK